jgi:hypothetical protein
MECNDEFVLDLAEKVFDMKPHPKKRQKHKDSDTHTHNMLGNMSQASQIAAQEREGATSAVPLVKIPAFSSAVIGQPNRCTYN